MRIEFIMSILILSVLSGCINTDKYQLPKNESSNIPIQTKEPYVISTSDHPLIKIDKMELYQDDKWDVGGGYVLVAYYIDDNTNSAWLYLFKDGKAATEFIGPEGKTYEYKNKFKTTFSDVYMKNETTNAIILTNTTIYP